MRNEPLSRALALRIGLAARVLPDTDPATLVRLLDQCVGRPFSEDKLQQLTPRRLRMASRGALAGVTPEVVRQAVKWLKGGGAGTTNLARCAAHASFGTL